LKEFRGNEFREEINTAQKHYNIEEDLWEKTGPGRVAPGYHQKKKTGDQNYDLKNNIGILNQ
jgi:hypothetical protein